MSEVLARLKQAMADRYTIEPELGRGGMATVTRQSVSFPGALSGAALALLQWQISIRGDHSSERRTEFLEA